MRIRESLHCPYLLVAVLLIAAMPARAQAPADTSCFTEVPVRKASWGSLKTRFTADGVVSMAAEPPVKVGRYTFWSDEHVTVDPVLRPAHKAICTEVYARVRAFAPRFALLGGDMTELGLAAEFDSLSAWMGDLRAIARPTPGNHEGFSAGGLDRYLAWAGDTGDSEYGSAYSFDDPHGGVRFIAGYSSYVETGNQGFFNWLEDRLRTTPYGWFIVYYQHNPPYSLARRGGAQLEAFTTLVPMLRRYKVDLFLAGHSHYYEVYQPGLGDPLYVVAGGGGMELSTISGSYPSMTIADQAAAHHYLQIEVSTADMMVEGIEVPAGTSLGRYTLPRQCVDRSTL